MEILKQLAIIFGVCLLSNITCSLLPFYFPDSVMGTIIMLVLLFCNIIKAENIKQVSQFLLANMALFFIPSGTQIIMHLDKIRDSAIIILFICIVTTLISFLATAYTVLFVMKLSNKKRGV